MKEIWKDIPGHKGKHMVSNFGNVKSVKYMHTNSERVLKQSINRCGYAYIILWENKNKKHYTIHRLVASTFIPNPNNYPQINHIDGNKLNNSVDNLEWCTASENVIHRFKVLKHRPHNCKKIKCVEKNIIYDSVTEAANKSGQNKVTIRHRANTQSGYFGTGGYHWEWVDD